MEQDYEPLLKIRELYQKIKGIQGNDEATVNILNVIFAVVDHLIKDLPPEPLPEQDKPIPDNFIELSTFYKRHFNKIGQSTLLAFVAKIKDEFPLFVKKVGRRWYVNPDKLVDVLAKVSPNAAIREKFLEYSKN